MKLGFCNDHWVNRIGQSALMSALGMMTASAAIMTFALAAPVSAASPQLDGSKARVNLSARLRSLTEDVAAATCRVQAGVDTEASMEHLATVRDTMETILYGLEHGDARLGMRHGEARGSLLRSIQNVRYYWDPMYGSIERMLNGAAEPGDYAGIVTNHDAMLEETRSLAASMSGVYSDPNSLLQRDAITLNFLGRQRSLATRFARTTCGIMTGTDAVGTKDELTEAMGAFDASYQALINGFPAAGVAPPPSDAVKSVLVEAYDAWQAQKTVLEAGLTQGTPTSADVQAAAEFADATVTQISNAITLFMIASPGQKDVFQASLEAYATKQLLPWLESQEVIDALRAQNAAHSGMSEDDVIALDTTWRAEAKGAQGTLISSTLARPLSQWLKDKQIATAGIVTEVFVMDNLGLNVGQSAQTSDYWQGDEAKWKETYGAANSEMHVGDLEFDESTRSYQTQASQLIVDPETGAPLGAVTFGINVINLM